MIVIKTNILHSYITIVKLPIFLKVFQLLPVIKMGLGQASLISLLLTLLPLLCFCKPSDVTQTEDRTVVENTVDERTQISKLDLHLCPKTL